jgi:glucosylceramidase
MPQNEFNSAQAFPSCTWSAAGLAKFIIHLGPVMAERHVEVFFGTLERGNIHLLDTTMDDPQAGKYIRGVGVQWAGKAALPQIHAQYPELAIYGSEQECGDGKNTWEYCGYCWDLMKDYLRNGASGYMYWNLSLKTGGLSHWGWAQNSLITVDEQAKTYRYNHEYYLLKHVSHFVPPGAHRVATQGTFDDVLAFTLPDKSVVVVARNATPYPRPLMVTVGARKVSIEMDAQSFHTIRIPAVTG